MKLSTTTTSTTTTSTTTTLSKTQKLNNGLAGFLKVRNTTIGKPKSSNRSSSQSNFRTTSDQTKLINDVLSFTFDFAANQSSVFTKTFTPILSVFSVAIAYCPFANITVVFNKTAKYRSFNDSCNNLANSPYIRFLPPAYQDGYNSARILADSEQPLPNPRTISLTISQPQPVQKLSNNITHLYPLFGQFLAHDLGGTAAITG